MEGEEYKAPKKIIIVPIKDVVVFPSMVVTIYANSSDLINAVSEASSRKELIGIITQKNENKPVPPVSNLYEYGTAVKIIQVVKRPSSNEAMILIEGIRRFKVKDFRQEAPYLTAEVRYLEKHDMGKNVSLQAGISELKSLIQDAAIGGKPIPDELIITLSNMQNFDEVVDIACSILSLDLRQKQELLEIEDPKQRLSKILEALNKEIQLLKIKDQIHSDISKELNKTEKEYLLRQELKAIQKELGDESAKGPVGLDGMVDATEIEELKKRIKASKMPKDVEKIANKELDRLQKIFPISPEYTVARTYIEWLCDMPWEKRTKKKVDIAQARKILDEDHYGLEKVKERILEYLAVCQLKENCGATILCFVGPPGVGKTSLGQSIARALGRAFVHTSLGGIRDEADVRGHRRTYVGALPGRIIQSIKRADFNDPVFMLDEIDKVGKDFQGDPAAALLEALDPEQNNKFTDHYLDVPFDLSRVFFITTANILDPIPPALLDRMEVIELPGYTEEEKLEIAKKYLVPKQFAANGIRNSALKFTDEAILKIIRSYTNEAGLRELERKIGSICRKAAKEMIEKKKKSVGTIGVKDIEKYLGVEKFMFERAGEKDAVGVATGLAWTPTGGDIIFIESSKMRGNKTLILTGNLGDVMQESARAALSFIQSNASEFDINEKDFDKADIHIHVPEGATPKDGPSAGITICTSLISLLTGRKVRRDVAMTGEVTLTGRILPIGGLKEKILAAKRALIKTIIIPEKNRNDLKEIPEKILKDINIVYAKTLEDVIKTAIIPKPVAKHRAKSGRIKSGKKIITRIVQLPVKQHR
jgi:ATP-dependent Lon protease